MTDTPAEPRQLTVDDMPERLQKLIGGVLYAMEQDDIKMCARLITRLNVEYPPGQTFDGVLLAMLAAVDWWAAAAGLTDDHLPNALGVVDDTAGPDEVMIGPVTTLSPKQQWAAQFAMSRLRKDHAMTEAMIGALPHDPAELGSYIINLFGLVATNVRKIREGFNPMPLRPMP